MLELGPGSGDEDRDSRRGGTGATHRGTGAGHTVNTPLTEPRCRSCLQGTCQWVTLDFPRTVKVSQLHIQFQGGFSSRLCMLEGEELVGGGMGVPLPQFTHSCSLWGPEVFVSHSQNPRGAEAVGWSRAG